MGRFLTAARLNSIRAAVLGANDGLVSVAAVTVGVAGATTSAHTILLAALAALVGGAISMGLGEYVSVASQRDGEIASGVHDVHDLVNPWSATVASSGSFTLGALVPLLAVLLTHSVLFIVLSVSIALAVAGGTAAHLSGSPIRRATIRTLTGGLCALAATYVIGLLLR